MRRALSAGGSVGSMNDVYITRHLTPQIKRTPSQFTNFFVRHPLVHAGVLPPAKLHRLVANEEVVFHGRQAKGPLVEGGGVPGRLAPDRPHPEHLGQANQPEKHSGADATEPQPHLPEHRRVTRGEIDDDVMAPRPPTVNEAEDRRRRKPGRARDQEKGGFRFRISSHRPPQSCEAFRSAVFAAIVAPAFGREPAVFDGIANMRIRAVPSRCLPASDIVEIGCISEIEPHRANSVFEADFELHGFGRESWGR